MPEYATPEEVSFTDSVARGTDQLQMSLYAFANVLGEATGFDAVAEWGLEGVEANLEDIRKNPPKIRDWDDVDGYQAFGEYVLERLGEQAAQFFPDIALGVAGGLIGAAGTGGVGALPGAVAGAVARKQLSAAVIGKAIKRKIGEKAYAQARTRAVKGANIGALASITAQNTGESQLELTAEGIDAPGTAIITGAVKGLIDKVGFDAVLGLGRMSGRSPEKLFSNIAKAAGVEATTEVVQTIADKLAIKAEKPEYQVVTEANLKEIREAFIVGGIAGGAFSAPGALTQKFSAGNEPAPTDDPDLENDTPTAEPQADTRAQVDALSDPTSTKDTVEITAETELPDDVQLPENAAVIPTENGTVITTNPEKAAELEASGGDQESVGQALFNTEGGKDGTDGTVAVARDADGAVVSEQLTNEQELPEAVAQAEGFAPEGGSVEVSDAGTQVQDRERRVTRELIGEERLERDQPQITREPEQRSDFEPTATTEELENLISGFNQNSPDVDRTAETDDINEGFQVHEPVEVDRGIDSLRTRIKEFNRDVNERVWRGNASQLVDELRPLYPLHKINMKETTDADEKRTRRTSKKGQFRVRAEARSFPTRDKAQAFADTLADTYPNSRFETKRVDDGYQLVEYTLPDQLGGEESTKSSAKELTHREDRIAVPERTQVAATAGKSAAKRLENKANSNRVRGDEKERAQHNFKHGTMTFTDSATGESTPLNLMHITSLGMDLNKGENVNQADFNEVVQRGFLNGYTSMLDAGFIPEGELGPDKIIYRIGSKKFKKAVAKEGETERQRQQREDKDNGIIRLGASHDKQQNRAGATSALSKKEKQAEHLGDLLESPEVASNAGLEKAVVEELRETNRGIAKLTKAIEKSLGSKDKTNFTSGNKALSADPDVDDDFSEERGSFESRVRNFVHAPAKFEIEENKRLDKAKKAGKFTKPKKNPIRKPADPFARKGAALSEPELIAAEAEKKANNTARVFEEDNTKIGSKLKNTETLPRDPTDKEKAAAVRHEPEYGAGSGEHKPTRHPRYEAYLNGKALEHPSAPTNAKAKVKAKLEKNEAVEVGDTIKKSALRDVSSRVVRQLRTLSRKPMQPLQRAILTRDGELRTYSTRLANIIYRPTNTVGEKSYQELRNNATDRWLGDLQKKTRDWHPSHAKKVYYLLATEADVRDQPVYIQRDVKMLRKFISKDFHAYLAERMPEMRRRQLADYFPRIYETAEIEGRPDEFLGLLQKHGMKEVEAREAMDNILQLQQQSMFESKSFVSQTTKIQNTRQLIDPKLVRAMVDEGFLNANPVESLTSYINSSVKRAELEDLFGDYIKLGHYIDDDGLGYITKGKGSETLEKGRQRVLTRLAMKSNYIEVDPKHRKNKNAQARVKAMKALQADYFERRTVVKGLGKDLRHDKTLRRLEDEFASLGYTDDVVKRMVRLGHLNKTDRGGYEVWMPSGGLRATVLNDPELKEHMEGLSKEERTKTLVRVRDLITGSIETQPIDRESNLYKYAGMFRAYESMRVLAFSGVASIPELAGAFARNKQVLPATEMAKLFASVTRNYKKYEEFAKDLGAIHESAAVAMQQDMYGAGINGTKGKFKKLDIRNALPYMFKYNGNNFIVNYSKVIAVETAKRFVKRIGTVDGENHARYLKELNIDKAHINHWIKIGEGHALDYTHAADIEAARAVQNAILRFTDESVLRPTASDRPAYSDHPLGGLIFHLKAFPYKFTRDILGGFMREAQARHMFKDVSHAKTVAWLAASAGIYTFLGGISDELRQRLLSMGEKGTFETQGYDPTNIATKWVDRSGLTSIPWIDPLIEPTWNQVAFTAGPTASHLNSLITSNDPAFKKLLKSIPGFSQLPIARRKVYEGIEALEDDEI